MTSKLESYLSKELYTRFGQYSIRQNYRPDWLEGLELDFYIDEIKLAAEVQRDQHYRFVPHFHKTLADFDSQRKRDEKKEYICRTHGVKLVEIFTEKDADLFVIEVKEITIANTPKYFYQDGEKDEIYFKKGGLTKQPSDNLLRAIKLLKRSISRNMNFSFIEKRLVRVFDILDIEGYSITDKEILKYREENKERFDGLVNDRRTCSFCGNNRKFSSKGLQEHVVSLHSEAQ